MYQYDTFTQGERQYLHGIIQQQETSILSLSRKLEELQLQQQYSQYSDIKRQCRQCLSTFICNFYCNTCTIEQFTKSTEKQISPKPLESKTVESPTDTRPKKSRLRSVDSDTEENGSVPQKICTSCNATSSSCWYRNRSGVFGHLCRRCYTTEYLKRPEVKPDGTLKPRECSICLVNETSAWYRDAHVPGQFNCIKCYQKRRSKPSKVKKRLRAPSNARYSNASDKTNDDSPKKEESITTEATPNDSNSRSLFFINLAAKIIDSSAGSFGSETTTKKSSTLADSTETQTPSPDLNENPSSDEELAKNPRENNVNRYFLDRTVTGPGSSHEPSLVRLSPKAEAGKSVDEATETNFPAIPIPNMKAPPDITNWPDEEMQ